MNLIPCIYLVFIEFSCKILMPLLLWWQMFGYLLRPFWFNLHEVRKISMRKTKALWSGYKNYTATSVFWWSLRTWIIPFKMCYSYIHSMGIDRFRKFLPTPTTSYIYYSLSSSGLFCNISEKCHESNLPFRVYRPIYYRNWIKQIADMKFTYVRYVEKSYGHLCSVKKRIQIPK